MANNYSIKADQISEDKYIIVKGNLTFGRISQLIQGDELVQVNQRRVQNGMSPINTPHTTVTIAQAEVQSIDPANPTLEDQFVSERRYTSKKHPEQGLTYSIDSKSNRPPAVFQLNEEGKVEAVQLAGELASGTPVRLVLRTYKPKQYNQRGIALEQVIIDQTGPIPYYRTATEDQLQAAGIVYAEPLATQQQAPAAPAQGQSPSAPSADETANLPLPQPGGNAPQAPVADAYRTQPQAPAQAPQPQQQAEDPQAELARLRAQLAEQQAAQQGQSAFAPNQGPWNGGQATQQGPTGIAYQG